MPIKEEYALEILAELIKKPESKSEDIPRIWREIMVAYNAQFAPPTEPAVKKRRRRPANPNVGWPAGVKRDEYKAWKATQEAKGVTENLNPQEYKRQRDMEQTTHASIGAPAALPLKSAGNSERKAGANAKKVPTAKRKK